MYNNNLLNHLFRGLGLLVLQAFIFNRIQIQGVFTPFPYFMFLLMLPYEINFGRLILIGFFYGMALDILSFTPGLHSATCTFLAFLRPGLLSLNPPSPTADTQNAEPRFWDPGPVWLFWTVLLAGLVHHLTLYLLEAFTFQGFWVTIGHALGSLGLSALFIFITELLFAGSRRRR